MTDAAYHPLYLQGIEQFNAAEFFRCHETWEELWMAQTGAPRRYYQGLIQAAVALHHLGRGNVRGARKLMARSRRYLDPFRPEYLGLDVDRFLAEMTECVCRTPDNAAMGLEEPARRTVAPPTIRLRSARAG